jgi:hypothetical protein
MSLFSKLKGVIRDLKRATGIVHDVADAIGMVVDLVAGTKSDRNDSSNARLHTSEHDSEKVD